MGTYGGEPRTIRHAGINSTPAQARTALSEALTELRRLTGDSLFGEVERALADLGSAPIGSESGVDAVRTLRQWSAEHQRVAIELEAAARCCRLVEREINQRVDALLDMPSAMTRRRAGPLRELLRRGRAARRPPRKKPGRSRASRGPRRGRSMWPSRPVLPCRRPT
jgi:hypothetical protein